MTQNARVLAFIRSHPHCTTMELQLGLQPFVSNPRARISDLRKAGYDVRCEKRGKREGYVLHEAPVQLTLSA